MQEMTANKISETKRLIKWIGENPTMWEAICGKECNQPAYFDQMEMIRNLQQNEFYAQILNLVFNPYSNIQHIAQAAIIEEILETWGKEQWDEVIDKVVKGLEEAHQEAKRQRAETAAREQAQIALQK